jgi:hypothetical protein
MKAAVSFLPTNDDVLRLDGRRPASSHIRRSRSLVLVGQRGQRILTRYSHTGREQSNDDTCSDSSPSRRCLKHDDTSCLLLWRLFAARTQTPQFQLDRILVLLSLVYNDCSTPLKESDKSSHFDIDVCLLVASLPHLKAHRQSLPLFCLAL